MNVLQQLRRYHQARTTSTLTLSLEVEACADVKFGSKVGGPTASHGVEGRAVDSRMFNRSIDVFQKSWLTSILAIPSSLAFHFAEPASIRQLGEKIQYSRDRPVHSPSGAINGAKGSSANLLVTQRFDPLVTPGIVSPHVHQIVGGNAFDVAMDPSIDYAKAATCTTCKFKEDASNYWTAVLYFKNPNGSYIRVPQMANQFTGSPNGGMTVYYIQPSNNQRVTSFPKGFRMIVGNPMVRNNTHRDANSAEARAITWRCFGANFASDNAYPHPGTGPLDTIELPKRACAGGIRSNVFFPSCWNGKDLDPADHASHVAWPTGTIPRDGHFFMGGSCPASHPVRLPLLFLEIVWDTRQFNNMWPTDGSQPFVLSQGDPTGFGQHADYVFGWDGDSLQRAMDRCTDLGGNPSGCRELTLVSDADMNRCTQQPRVDEVVEGRYLNAMPGCNPVQNGPNEATMINNCNAVSTYIGQPAAPTQTSAPTVTAAPPVPTTTTVVNPQPTAPAGPAVPKYGQCGGVGWTGSTACTAGTTCQKMNDWYSQCL